MFRSVWAAALPIITGVAGVAVSTLAVTLLSHVMTLPSVVTSMGALIGLGVGIDYALFVVNRQRKALRSGADLTDAITIAMDTSGRAVLFAGGTVMVALLGMFILNVGFLSGHGRRRRADRAAHRRGGGHAAARDAGQDRATGAAPGRARRR